MTVPYPTPQPKRPSLVWLILPIVLVLGGVGSCSGLLYSGVKNAVQSKIYESSGLLHLDKGKYTIYVHNAQASLATEDGSPLGLSDYESDLTLTKGGADYTADKTFTADYSGTYRLTIKGDGGVAIGHGLAHDAGTIGLGFGLAAVLILAAIAALAVILTLRSRNQPGPPGGYPVSGYGYPGQAPNNEYGRHPGYGPPQQYGQQPGNPPQQYGQQPGNPPQQYGRQPGNPPPPY